MIDFCVGKKCLTGGFFFLPQQLTIKSIQTVYVITNNNSDKIIIKIFAAAPK